jgi:hypothetical protein
MTFGPGTKLAGLLFTALSASGALALPPPVDMAPVVVIASHQPELAAPSQKLIGLLSRDKWIATSLATTEPARLAECLTSDEWKACAAAVLASSTAAPSSVAVFIDHPAWQSAAIRMRCVGSDSSKASEVRVHLDDALVADGQIAPQERQRAASCLIGALHGGVED